MLRIHFEPGDLARTRVADGPDPLWELVFSLQRLRDGAVEPALAGWLRLTRRHGADALRTLLPLVPPYGYFPDFLTPAAADEGFDAGLAQLLATPQPRLHAELTRLESGAPRDWLRDVAHGSGPALRRLGDALHAYHRDGLRRAWNRIDAEVAEDREMRVQVAWTGGAQALLRSFGRGIRWRPPVLEVPYPVPQELHLHGRGLLLVPSYFCRRMPVSLLDPALPPVLVYPVQHARGRGAPPPAAAHQRLGELLGHTRAAVLMAIGGACTTTELASRAGVSMSSASEHASVLRRAGLVHTARQGNRVRHVITPLGQALLTGRSDRREGLELVERVEQVERVQQVERVEPVG